MLDFRHETFLALCKIGNYTKTAEHLHITQPAVTQHIQYLEEHYGCRLFVYEKRRLSLTRQGEMLRDFVATMRADSGRIGEILSLAPAERRPLLFGATLTIGEYVMPPVLGDLFSRYPDQPVSMLVDNTEALLGKLDGGEIDFALLEGFFDKAMYESRLLSTEAFVPVCSPGSPLSERTVSFDELLDQRLILREKGSGTRDIFERTLHRHNLTVQGFRQVDEIGNMSAIKQLVCGGFGITFLYRAAAQAELLDGRLSLIRIAEFDAAHEFNFVFLKRSQYREEYLAWHSFFHDAIRDRHRQMG